MFSLIPLDYAPAPVSPPSCFIVFACYPLQKLLSYTAGFQVFVFLLLQMITSLRHYSVISS